MPESRLARQIARHTGIRATVCAAVLRGAADTIYHEWKHGKSVHLPGVGTIVPSYRGPKNVACNLPNRIHRRYRITVRKTAKLQPAPNLKSEEPYCPEATFVRDNRTAMVFV